MFPLWLMHICTANTTVRRNHPLSQVYIMCSINSHEWQMLHNFLKQLLFTSPCHMWMLFASFMPDEVEAHATATNFLWGIWAIHIAKIVGTSTRGRVCLTGDDDLGEDASKMKQTLNKINVVQVHGSLTQLDVDCFCSSPLPVSTHTSLHFGSWWHVGIGGWQFMPTNPNTHSHPFLFYFHFY